MFIPLDYNFSPVWQILFLRWRQILSTEFSFKLLWKPLEGPKFELLIQWYENMQIFTLLETTAQKYQVTYFMQAAVS